MSRWMLGGIENIGSVSCRPEGKQRHSGLQWRADLLLIAGVGVAFGKQRLFVACNWLMAVCAVAICFFAFVDVFTTKPVLEWSRSVRQRQTGVVPALGPLTPMGSPPSAVIGTRPAMTLQQNHGAARSPAVGAGQPSASSSKTDLSVWGNAPYANAPPTPIPALNPYILPPGMENEANPYPKK
jgi:hypothetical protein